MTKKFLDQALVTKYAKVSALVKRLETWMKEKREAILKQFEDGYASPTGGPYLLERVSTSRSEVSWKDEFRSYLVERFLRGQAKGDQLLAEAMADRYLDKIKNDAPKVPGFRLEPKINPNYRIAETSPRKAPAA